MPCSQHGVRLWQCCAAKRACCKVSASAAGRQWRRRPAHQLPPFQQLQRPSCPWSSDQCLQTPAHCQPQQRSCAHRQPQPQSCAWSCPALPEPAGREVQTLVILMCLQGISCSNPSEHQAAGQDCSWQPLKMRGRLGQKQRGTATPQDVPQHRKMCTHGLSGACSCRAAGSL